ncbi:MAG TPA: hypothetical protein VFA10_07060 [Ktedonobacteraceae bacterium]|nr:hypothetical protein [Ktedonobacteraceae bacterium]
MDTPEIRKTLEEISGAGLTTPSEPTPSFSAPTSRRRLLYGAAGVAGVAVAGVAATALINRQAVHAEGISASSILTEYFSILATGEALFVTFYSHGVANHEQLGIQGSALTALKAILTEEQIHLNFALAHGGVPATTHFSFPHGPATFQDRALFLATQQLGEDLTNGALLAWIKDMATMDQPRLAQIGGQLMQVEGGHRVVGRVIMNANPWDNWAFGPVALNSFLQVPAVVKAAGFLSPRPGNDFAFHPVSASFPGVINTKP